MMKKLLFLTLFSLFLLGCDPISNTTEVNIYKDPDEMTAEERAKLRLALEQAGIEDTK